MSREHTFRHGAFEVILTETEEDELGEIADAECDCGGYAENQNTMGLHGPNNWCKHIREVVMYRYYKGKVSPVAPEN